MGRSGSTGYALFDMCEYSWSHCLLTVRLKCLPHREDSQVRTVDIVFDYVLQTMKNFLVVLHSIIVFYFISFTCNFFLCSCPVDLFGCYFG